jgi:hypothetical protein
MKKEIEEIRAALIAIDAYDEATGEALASLEESLEEIDSHPAVGRVREVIGSTAGQVSRPGGSDSQEEGVIAEKWHDLKDHLDEWEDHHPTVVLSVGKVAEALAVLGL